MTTRATPRRTAPTAPQPVSQGGALDLQIAHVKAHLERFLKGQASVSEPEQVYLGHEEEDHFWELIGLRMPKSPAPQLAAVRFRKHDFPGEPHARESLASYLSTPGTQTAGALLLQPNTLAMLLPRITDPVPDFLSQLRTGRALAPVGIDPANIEVAFDLRTHNPSFVGSLRRSSIPLKPRFFRTQCGHVLSGLSHDPNDPHQPGNFLSIKSPIQHTRKGRLVLPDLAINRRFILLSSDVTEDEARLAAPNWAAFSALEAEPKHLLLA